MIVKDIALGVIFAGCPFIVHVVGHSMYPTLRHRSICMFNPFATRFRRGDIVSADVDGEKVIKRVIGVGGDRITITRYGNVILNGGASDEPYIQKQTAESKPQSVTVPDGYVWLMGDNRGASTDSRTFGAVSVNNIRGRLIKRRNK